ncbi:integrin alpha-6 isoform X2 [Mugil cephalus]|uniref:integrin alpha-6 isoform X2 n=1 Tax=Mugil cephalus TaxID=48193 RepID=UPI001FB75CEF|nr:integrin alpha-6 isoform X2 [Mugil cephalus]
MPMQKRTSAVPAALFLYFCFLELSSVLAFNLDTSHVMRKDGKPGSLFGFSLAMHRQLNPDKRMVLIGAPRAGGWGKQTANITGGLYKCEISPYKECERIEFDNGENQKDEIKENQWMGVTVQSQGPGGKIVTCAHLYQRLSAQDSTDITGRCYILSQDLSIDPSSDEDGGDWAFCKGRTRGHSFFGTCQQGMAATFTKDYHYMIFGAPGAYNWKGIVRVEQKNATLLDRGVYDDGPYEVGDEGSSNADLVPLPSNSYLGFSLDSGHRITQSRGLTVVAGAPRANHSGAVVLLKKESETSRKLLFDHTFHGQGLASSFGYDVAVVDLNNDGWEDIVVGAPQFYMKAGDIGGAVYVYINNRGQWDTVTPVRLNGTKDSMFGLAVENIGDINQDSYADIAVGAPHDDDGAGKVYIYHGSAEGIQTSPAQILSGKDHNVRFFGYSLAGNLDLDDNSYPDLAVGSLSDTAFIYRARPLVSIKKKVTISPQEIDLTIKTCGNSICLTVKSCFSYNAKPASYSPKLTIRYVVEADGDRRKQGLNSRLMFLNQTHSEFGNYYYNNTLDLPGQNQEKCITLDAKLKDDIKDKMRSIPIEVSADIVIKDKRPKNGLPYLWPIVDPSQPSKDVTEVNFVKEGCGKDHVCRSNLMMEYSLCYKDSKGDMSPLNKSSNNIPEFVLNYEKNNLVVRVTVNNMNGDDAYEAKLVGSFSGALSYSGVRNTGDKLISCVSHDNVSQADCELGNPFKRNSKITFYILLSTENMPLNTTEIEIDLQLRTTSVQENIAHVKVKAAVIIELPLSVSGEANPRDVYFGGAVKGESAMKTEEEIGTLITYTFTINNLWKHLKPSVSGALHIQWPKSNKDGKWLLYLVKITSKGPEKVRCSPESEINPVQVSSGRRTKRETVKKENKSASQSGKRKVLSCQTSQCVEFRCPLQGHDGTTIELRARLWNSTFIEDYTSFSTTLVVNAFLVLDTLAKNIKLTAPYTQVNVTVSPEGSPGQFGGAPWWIILVAVLAGILILALLVYLLWKCGFFKRSKQDESVPRYNAVRIKKETPEYRDGKAKLDLSEKKQWMTTWIDNESYS